MISRQALKLNWEGTNRMLQAAVAKAEELAVPMSIAIVDEGGHLLGFARTDAVVFIQITQRGPDRRVEEVLPDAGRASSPRTRHPNGGCVHKPSPHYSRTQLANNAG